MFEGDPASLSDVEAIAQTMLNALGLPEVRYRLQAVGECSWNICVFSLRCICLG